MIDKKGFVLTETLIVIVFLVTIFTFIYVSIVPLMGKYEDMTVRSSDIDIVYIDYLDLLRMNTYNIEKKEAVDPTKILHFQELLSKLAALAYELSLSIVVLSQESSQGSFEDIIDELNLLTSTIEHSHHIIKMFIGRDNLFSTKIDCNDISHVVLVEGYNLKHFASVNVKQLYKD